MDNLFSRRSYSSESGLYLIIAPQNDDLKMLALAFSLLLYYEIMLNYFVK